MKLEWVWDIAPFLIGGVVFYLCFLINKYVNARHEHEAKILAEVMEDFEKKSSFLFPSDFSGRYKGRKVEIRCARNGVTYLMEPHPCPLTHEKSFREKYIDGKSSIRPTKATRYGNGYVSMLIRALGSPGFYFAPQSANAIPHREELLILLDEITLAAERIEQGGPFYGQIPGPPDGNTFEGYFINDQGLTVSWKFHAPSKAALEAHLRSIGWSPLVYKEVF